MHSLTEAMPPLAIWATGAGILVLLLLSALLSGSGTALSAASRGRLHGMAERGDRRAATALALTDEKERLIGAVLFGGNTANILAAALATWLCVHLLGAAGVAVAAVATTALVIVFSEVMPKAYALTRPEAVALRVAGFARVAVAVFSPLVGAVRGLVGLVLGLVGVETDPGADVLTAQAEIAGAIELGHSEGLVEKAERDRLLATLDLGQRRIEEVMMHRRDIELIDAESPPAEIMSLAINSPHTRLPIFRGEPENIVGVIHAKDLLRAVHAFAQDQRGEGALEGFDVMDVAMEPYFVPESSTLDDQLREFLRRRTHFALVVDEYGALQGLVTLEDIIEEIVGDIADEHDVEVQAGIEPQPDGSVEVEGAVTIRDLNRARDWDLPDEEANTIAGLVIHEAQAIPSEGQGFSFHGYRFEVLGRDHNRLTRLRVRRLP